MKPALKELLVKIHETYPSKLFLYCAELGYPVTEVKFCANMLYEKDLSFISEFDHISQSISILQVDEGLGEIHITFAREAGRRTFFNVLTKRKEIQKLIPPTPLGRQLRELVYIKKINWLELKDTLHRFTFDMFHGWSPLELPQAEQTGNLVYGEMDLLGILQDDVTTDFSYSQFITIPLRAISKCPFEELALRINFAEGNDGEIYLVGRTEKDDPWSRINVSVAKKNYIQHRILKWCSEPMLWRMGNPWRILSNRKPFLEVGDCVKVISEEKGSSTVLPDIYYLADLELYTVSGATGYHFKKPGSVVTPHSKLYGVKTKQGFRLFSRTKDSLSYDHGSYVKTENGWVPEGQAIQPIFFNSMFYMGIMSRLDSWEILFKDKS